jgi:hypothetical protein
LRPHDLHSAYGLPPETEASGTQTVAIVDAYNDLGAAADLRVYDQEFGLPECTSIGSNPCLRQVNQEGRSTELPFPNSAQALQAESVLCRLHLGTESSEAKKRREEACERVNVAQGWTEEISLDIEITHAICQNCRILLVEANSGEYPDLEAAEETAVRLGASAISNSWGGSEPASDSEAFNHPGVAITAAAGDYGYLNWDASAGFRAVFGETADFPAVSPHVVAVGGTRLGSGTAGEWTGETAWNDGSSVEANHGAGGSGCSENAARFPAASWQRSVPDWSSVGCESKRAVADIAADADPYTGAAVFDSTPPEGGTSALGWATLGGTSLSSPIIAASLSLAGGVHSESGYPAQTLYENETRDPGSLHGLSSGSNGACNKPVNHSTGASGCTPAEEAASCSGHLICLAGPGYNGPGGVGTPDGLCAFQAPGSCQTISAGPGQGVTGSGGGQTGATGPTGATNGSQGGQGPSGAGAGGASEAGLANPPVTGSTNALTPPSSVSSPPNRRRAGSTPAVVLSGLALVPRAAAALRHAGTAESQVAFRYKLSTADRVRITLAKQIGGGRHARWQGVGAPLSPYVSAGRHRGRLGSRRLLAPGRYRLTLAPAGGAARSLALVVR